MKTTLKETALFGMLGSIMFASKLALEFLPNVHLLAVFTVAFTYVFRAKALFPIYIYVVLLGIFNGFATWWIPHMYLWTLLWAVIMLLPKNMKPLTQTIVFCLICALHGFLYGILYAPAQALLFGLSFKGMISWIIAGLPWDAFHGCSNLVLALLCVPLIKILNLCKKTVL